MIEKQSTVLSCYCFTASLRRQRLTPLHRPVPMRALYFIAQTTEGTYLRGRAWIWAFFCRFQTDIFRDVLLLSNTSLCCYSEGWEGYSLPVYKERLRCFSCRRPFLVPIFIELIWLVLASAVSRIDYPVLNGIRYSKILAGLGSFVMTRIQFTTISSRGDVAFSINASTTQRLLVVLCGCWRRLNQHADPACVSPSHAG